MPAPQSLADLLAEDSGDDVDKMQVDLPREAPDLGP